MANKTKTERILDNAREMAGDKAYAAAAMAAGPISRSDPPAKQAAQVNMILAELDKHVGKDTLIGVMMACNCLSNSVIERAQKAYRTARDLPSFLSALNAMHIGGGALRLDGGKIIGTYSRCYCQLAKGGTRVSPDYCYCSAGWFHRLFSTVLDRPVCVTPVHTIMGGAESCVFEIEPQ